MSPQEQSLAEHIRELAEEMVRLDRWATEASRANRWQRAWDLQISREHAREHRSELMRELWQYRHG
ncbi:MAG TPA: hypothetical protein VFB50_17705 [Chloroflexota bacterium]|nr:hypothetical protein [Chloroflexota bacterium]